MEHEIQPALTDREWQNWQRQTADGRIGLLDGAIAGKRWDALAALANAARDDADPGKITWDDLSALAEALLNFRAFASTQGEFGKQLLAQYLPGAVRVLRACAALLPRGEHDETVHKMWMDAEEDEA